MTKKGIIARLRQIFTSKEQRRAQKAHKVLVDWQTMYKNLQSHPLTQAKIVNEQLLTATNEALSKVDSRLNELEKRIERVEKRKIKIIRKIKQSFDEPAPEKKSKKIRKKKEPKKVVIKKEPQQVIKQIVADARMSDQERQIVALIEKEQESDAETIAKAFNISRSNASLKLNKLYDWGYLDKRMDGKTVFYYIKD